MMLRYLRMWHYKNEQHYLFSLIQENAELREFCILALVGAESNIYAFLLFGGNH